MVRTVLKPTILTPSSIDTFMAIADYVANENGCRIKYENNKMQIKGDRETAMFSLKVTYENILGYNLIENRRNNKPGTK
ncbi:hypothetical protein ISS05_00980 [Candidatus Woesearchaeota archaeon]|nr:hypothetical protein [Candidatus Woesearchaeota archaeon]